MDATLLRAFATLIACAAGLGTILFFVKRYAGKARKKIGGLHLEIISRVALQQKQHLYVVKAGDKTLLLGATDQSINILSELNGENPQEALEKTLGASLQNPASQAKIFTPKKAPELSATAVGADVPSFGDFLKSIIKGERVN